MPVFRIEVLMYGTAYIKADDAAAARKLADDNLTNSTVYLARGYYGEVAVSDESFDSPGLPQVSLSIVATIKNPVDGEPENVED